MSKNHKTDYWLETLSCCLEEVGKFNLFTKEELQNIAEGLAGSAEVQSEYFGEHYIPNPIQTELDNYKRTSQFKLEELEKSKERELKETVENARGRILYLQHLLDEERNRK